MDVHVLAQAILYFCISITGFIVSIPVGVNRWNFRGRCILYADVKWKDNYHSQMYSSHSVNCNFPIYYSVFGMIFYGFGLGIFYAFATFKSMRTPEIGYQMWVMPYILLNGVHAFVTLIVSCILSVGFLQFCNRLKEKDWVKSCGQFANDEWSNPSTGEKFNAGPYTTLLAVAQIASWSCLLLFLAQMGLSILRFVRNRRQRSESTDVGTDRSKIAETESTA
ncbi:transmembrane protein 179-like [Mercenaria mercenaria]|uniref:transmembrane protein 179-like n=1 Tax=Mercenaria mercenaria TaxID=6596 RepID=UPI00234EC396|nr:transmembrane protein 179-like [Mercenaria mercenaria]